MPTGTNDIFKTINRMYKKQTWSKRYGTQIWIVIFIFCAWAGIMGRLHAMNHVHHLKQNWSKNRCLPYVLPVAGHVHKPDGMSALEYTAQNFTFCINGMLKDLMELAIMPITVILASLSLIVDMILEAINVIRKLFAWLVSMIMAIIAYIMGIFANITVATQLAGANIPDAMSKLTGVFTTGVNLGQSIFDTSLSGFKIAINLMIIIAVAFIVIYFFLYYFSMVTFFCIGCPFKIPAILMFIFVCIVCAFIIVFAEVLKHAMEKANKAPLPPPAQHTNSVPNPACFSKNTKIMLKSKKVKKIHEIQLGDILIDGGNVTSIMKCSSKDQDIYNLYGTIVTGKHGVKNKENTWIHVEKHPDAQLVSNFNEPFVYCINTSSKNIIINNTCFSDWDDLDEIDMEDIKKHACLNTTLPSNFTPKDIHLHLDAGFSPSTQIKLQNKQMISLAQVKINDVLDDGVCVQGIVHVEGKDLLGCHKMHIFDKKTIECTKNIFIYNTPLGTLNTHDCEIISTKTEPYYIHLLTNTGSFNIQGVKVGDYNTCIEKYLSTNGKI